MIKPAIKAQFEQLIARYQELSALLVHPDTLKDQNKIKAYGQERAKLEPLVMGFQSYQSVHLAWEEAKELVEDEDVELQALAKEELLGLEKHLEVLKKELLMLLLPKDPNDACNVFLEVRAGTGGDEAAIFAGDLLKMYLRYAELKGWQTELISMHEADHGGYKEVVARISGKGVYSCLKFESGAHRVQRVPVTESQGRIHTSACTVAILPEVEAVKTVEIDPSHLRIDTFRASGAGGQHVNKTDSAVRITYKPTGLVVECQDDRSQHKNRARAMSLLQTKLIMQKKAEQKEEQSKARRNLVGSGDRSERIRTYNFPQGRVTDHRIHLTLYKLSEIIEGGALDEVIKPLIQEDEARQLSDLEQA